jgi:glyoxylase-like metal-dependent hydrolase (beta-lactamase superfamily II)
MAATGEMPKPEHRKGAARHGREDLIGDERYARPRAGYDRQAEVDALDTEWTQQHTKFEAMEILGKYDVPRSAFMSLDDIAADDHLRRRGVVAEIDHPQRGSVVLPGDPIKMSGSQVPVRPAPLLGDSNQEILGGLLGLCDAQLEELSAKGVIQQLLSSCAGRARMTEVLPGIHQFRLPLTGSPLRHVNGYLLRGDDGYTLVDCGWKTDDVLETLRAELKNIGADLGDIRTLIVTHFHPDHYGLAGTLVELGKLRLMMHRLDWLHVSTNAADPMNFARSSADWLCQHGLPGDPSGEAQRAIDAFQRFTVVQPDVQLEDNSRISVGANELRVVWTPGHTAGHICLHDAEREIVLTGDHVLDPITPSVNYMRPGLGNPLGSFLESLRKVAELDADFVLPAHGEPFHGLRRRIDEILEHHNEREAAALSALAGGPISAAEVAEQLPWTRRRQRLSELPPFQQRMALGETIAHLEELRATERVVSSEDNGLIYYALAGA